MLHLAGFYNDDEHMGLKELARKSRDIGEGYTLDELALQIVKAVKQIVSTNPVNLVLHDWGSLLGLIIYDKKMLNVNKIVATDVGFVFPQSFMSKIIFAL